MNYNKTKWFFLTLFLSIWCLFIPDTHLQGNENGQVTISQFQIRSSSYPSLVLDRITIDQHGLTADFILTNKGNPYKFFLWKYGCQEAYYIKGLDKKVNLKLIGGKNIEFEKHYYLPKGASISFSLVFEKPPDDMKHFSILEGLEGSKVKTPAHFLDLKLPSLYGTELAPTAISGDVGSISLHPTQRTLVMKILLEKDMEPLKIEGFTPDGYYLVTSCSSTQEIIFWDVFTGALTRTIKGIINVGEITAFSKDMAYVLTSTKDGTKLWETFSGKELRRFDGPQSSVKKLLFSPDNQKFLTLTDGANRAIIQDIHSGKILFQLDSSDDLNNGFDAKDARFSRDSRYIAVTFRHGLNYDNIVKVWEISSGNEVNSWTFSNRGEINTLGFSPDSKHLFIGGYTMNVYRKEARFLLCNLSDKNPVKEFRGGEYSVSTFAFHPDNLHYMAPQYNKVSLWNVNVSEEQLYFQDEEKMTGICSVDFHPQGRYFITGGFFSPLRLRDWYTLEILFSSPNELAPRVEKVLFNRSGDRFAVEYGRGKAHLYAFIEGDMVPQFETVVSSKGGTQIPMDKLLQLYAAKKKAERDKSLREMFAKYEKENTILAYKEFLEKFPEAPQAMEAKLQILVLQQKEYEAYKKKNTIEAYNEFVTLYPDYPQVADAISNVSTIAMQGEVTPGQLKIISDLREKSPIIKDFLLVTRLQTEKASDKYLNKYKHQKEAACYVDYMLKDELERIGTIKEAEAFIQRYPHSFYIPRLEKWLLVKREELETQKEQEQELLEKSAYRHVMAAGSLEAAGEFIARYPDSEYISEVKKMMAEKMTAIQQQELAAAEAAAKLENFLTFVKKHKTKDSPLKNSEYVKKAELWLSDFFKRIRERLKTGADIREYNAALTKYSQLSYAEEIITGWLIKLMKRPLFTTKKKNM